MLQLSVELYYTETSCIPSRTHQQLKLPGTDNKLCKK